MLIYCNSFLLLHVPWRIEEYFSGAFFSRILFSGYVSVSSTLAVWLIPKCKTRFVCVVLRHYADLVSVLLLLLLAANPSVSFFTSMLLLLEVFGFILIYHFIWIYCLFGNSLTWCISFAAIVLFPSLLFVGSNILTGIIIIIFSHSVLRLWVCVYSGDWWNH